MCSSHLLGLYDDYGGRICSSHLCCRWQSPLAVIHLAEQRLESRQIDWDGLVQLASKKQVSEDHRHQVVIDEDDQ